MFFSQLCLLAPATFPICWTHPTSSRRSYGPNTKHSLAESFLSSLPSCGSWQNSFSLLLWFSSSDNHTCPLLPPNPSCLISIYKSLNMPSGVLSLHSFSSVTSPSLGSVRRGAQKTGVMRWTLIPGSWTNSPDKLIGKKKVSNTRCKN